METSDIGLIGLAVMGENLALNMENKGFTVSVFNRNYPGEEGVVDRFITGRGKGKNFIGTHSMEEFVKSIERPRKIMMMIRAGSPVDEMIAQLLPLLSEGDIIIDGGNSNFTDTARRVEEVESKGMLFIGAGISGGELGALHGPSIMPGGSPEAWPLVKPILQAIAAKLDDGTPCCQWIGKGGAGHFVKTVHNGIEYGDMQLIAEAYALLKHRKNLSNKEMSDVFHTWNNGELDSYLIDITSQILNYKDEDGHDMIDKILDVAGQKGTGKWASVAAMDENDPLTLITEAVYARLLSSMIDERTKAATLFPPAASLVSLLEVDDIRQSLYASKLISYVQGFSLLRKASLNYGWNLNLGVIAQIWRKGCIIRSVFLQKITDAYTKNPVLENLLFDDFFAKRIKEAEASWRKVVAEGATTAVPVPAMSSALNYFDGLRTLHSNANLIQAQRDFFGAHTYERTDQARGVFFHTNWSGSEGHTTSTTYNK